MFRCRLSYPVLLCATVIAGCETAKSSNPLSPDVAGPISGVAITAPTPIDPPQNGEVVSDGYPMTFTAQNATTNGQRQLFLQLQVASDFNFTTLVHHNERVEFGADGTTKYRMPELLASDRVYYWRVRAADGANTGPYSFTSAFSLVNAVTIETPMPLEPAGQLNTNKPTFRVRNGRVENTSVYYRFEIATAPDPSAIIAINTVAPGSNGETTTSLGDLPYSKTFYWRVYATDGTHHSGYSAMVSFTTVSAPGGGGGGGGGGTGGGTGGSRTPNPAPGQRLPEPNGFPIAQAVASQYPHYLFNSCQEHGGTWQFMDALVDALRKTDTRYGYGWKRGVVGDPLMDVVTYNWSADPDEGTRNLYTFDVIGGHCGSNPVPVWNNTQPGGGPGATSWTGRGRF
jgi:hypothetical protein